jgi:periplasmic protein TonB
MMSAAPEVTSSASLPHHPEPTPLPTLMGEGYGIYRCHPSAFFVSFGLNVLVVALLVYSGHWVIKHHETIHRQVMGIVADVSPYILPASSKKAGGGGGGGDRDKLAASKGHLPKQALDQITPPAVVVRNEAPKLIAEPTVVAPQILLSKIGPLGDPLSNILGPPSNGTGSGGGIGTGTGGGVGSGSGPGVGPGHGGGVGGGAYRIGGGVSPPRAIYAPDPDYSEEARKAKYQGTVILWVIVGIDGRPRDIRVMRSVGMGLEQKAIEAVRIWKFDPGRKDGHPVAVQVNIEVAFRLY